jgi:hypothetical protein
MCIVDSCVVPLLEKNKTNKSDIYLDDPSVNE